MFYSSWNLVNFVTVIDLRGHPLAKRCSSGESRTFETFSHKNSSDISRLGGSSASELGVRGFDSRHVTTVSL